MILHWDQIVLHYGQHGNHQIQQHERKFAKAHRSTFGILYSPVCFTSDDIDFTLGKSGNGLHAEESLLHSAAWKQQIPAALKSHITGVNSSFNVIIGLNRTPCRSCTEQLIQALNQVHKEFPVRASNNRFILACLGFYGPSRTQPGARTTVRDLKRLMDAGWELAALQVGANLTLHGQMLQHQLQHLGSRGIMRLEH